MLNRVEQLRAGRVGAGALSLVLASFVALLLMTGTASAKQQLLEEAKAAGQVGEQFDGYLGIVNADIPDNIKKLVKDTNERRKVKYEEVATTRGLEVAAVAQLAGAKLITRANPGEFVKGEDGKWVKAVGQ
jgi:uncharacterized protein YdbL (DUF1318 family)